MLAVAVPAAAMLMLWQVCKLEHVWLQRLMSCSLFPYMSAQRADKISAICLVMHLKEQASGSQTMHLQSEWSLRCVPALVQAFVDKFRYNAKRASLVQSRIKAIERMEDVHVVEDDPEYIFRCEHLLSH